MSLFANVEEKLIRKVLTAIGTPRIRTFTDISGFIEKSFMDMDNPSFFFMLIRIIKKLRTFPRSVA